jgi:hypothetical protein
MSFRHLGLLLAFFLSLKTLSQNDSASIVVKISTHHHLGGYNRPIFKRTEYLFYFDTTGVLLKKTHDALYMLGTGPWEYTCTFSYIEGKLSEKQTSTSYNNCKTEYLYTGEHLTTSTQNCQDNFHYTYITRTNYTYDSVGRLSKKRQKRDSDLIDKTFIESYYEYQYDSLGRLIEEKFFSKKFYDYQYDSLGRLKEEKYPTNEDLRYITKNNYKGDTVEIIKQYKPDNFTTTEERIYIDQRLQFGKDKNNYFPDIKHYCTLTFKKDGCISKIEHFTQWKSQKVKFNKSYNFRFVSTSKIPKNVINKINWEVIFGDDDFLVW